MTPGEYVINKAAAQKIGYNNLNSMNKTGVARFATGGPVGIQRFADGGFPIPADSQGSLNAFNATTTTPTGVTPGSLLAFEKATKDATKATQDNTKADKDSTKSVKDMNEAFDSTPRSRNLPLRV